MSFESALKLALDETFKRDVERWATNKHGNRFPILSNVCQIDYSQIKKYEREAGKEHVSLGEVKSDVEWYGIVENGKIVSFYGLMIKGDKARFKGNYTLKEHRRKGHTQSLIEHAKKKAKSRGCKTMDLYCTEMSEKLHKRNGAVQLGANENHLVYYL